MMRTGTSSKRMLTLRIVNIHNNCPQNDRQRQRQDLQQKILLFQKILLHLPAPPFHLSRMAAIRLLSFLLLSSSPSSSLSSILLQNLGRQMALEHAADGDRDRAGLLGDDHEHAVRASRSCRPPRGGACRDRATDSGCPRAAARSLPAQTRPCADDHRAVMQRAVLEENVLDQLGGRCGIDSSCRCAMISPRRSLRSNTMSAPVLVRWTYPRRRKRSR